MKNPALTETRRGELADMTPRRQLLDDNGSEICRCAGVRGAAIKCLERLEDSSELPEIIEKKRACAEEVIGNPLA